MSRTALVPRTETIVGPPASVMNSILTQSAHGRLLTHPDDIRFDYRPDGMVAARVSLLVHVRYHDDSFQQVVRALSFIFMVLAFSGLIVWAIAAAVPPFLIWASVMTTVILASALVFWRFSRTN